MSYRSMSAPRRWLIPAMHTGFEPHQKRFCNITGKENKEFLEWPKENEQFTGHSTGRQEREIQVGRK